MRIVSEEQIKKVLSGELNEGIYFIHGNEAYLIKHYCSQLFSRFEDGTGFNMQRFDYTSNPQEIYNAVCQLPFFSEKKCVAVCDVDFDDLKEETLNIFHETIRSVGTHCVLVFWYSADSANIGKEKTKKIVEEIEKAGGIICRLDKKTSIEISRILCNGAAKRGCKLSSATANYMIEQCSDDLTNLVTELDKVCAYVGQGGNITPKDIDKICIRTIDVKTYQLGSAIMAGKSTDAMAVLDDLFYMNFGPELILGAIASPFYDIIRVRIMKDRSIGDVVEDFGYGKRDFVVRNALSTSNKMDDKRLWSCIDTLNECDYAVKFSTISDRIALEQATLKLCHIMSGRDLK